MSFSTLSRRYQSMAGSEDRLPAGCSRKAPVPRPAGRVICFDQRSRVLLLRNEDHTCDEPVLWLTPGGACEPGETFEQAALREFFEETGISLQAPLRWVWTRKHVWRWGERWIETEERYFLARTEGAFKVTGERRTRAESPTIREHRLWTVSELLKASGAIFVPRRLPELTAALERGEIPSEPVETGI